MHVLGSKETKKLTVPGDKKLNNILKRKTSTISTLFHLTSILTAQTTVFNIWVDHKLPPCVSLTDFGADRSPETRLRDAAPGQPAGRASHHSGQPAGSSAA